MPSSPPSAESPVAIRISNVAKRYARLQVLDGMDLDIRRGEFFGLVGVNGAGKTTCIKGLLDYTSIDSGGFEIFGTHHREPRAREQLAFLPERFLPPLLLERPGFSRLHGTAAWLHCRRRRAP